jgi:HAE1 family hydrophobic/amphiphilic exporter-1
LRFCVVEFIGFFKLGINLLTLAGFALGFGMLVDNAIVLVENIQRLKGSTDDDDLAIAAKGTTEVGVAIFVSTLTTMLAFVPLIYFFTGELRIKANGSPNNSIPFSPTAPFTPSLLQVLYKRLLAIILHWRWAVILLALGIFSGATYIFLKEVTRGSPWKWGEETYIVVWARLPTGAQLERADAIARFFEERVVGQSQVERVFALVSAEYANLRITLSQAAQFFAYPLTGKNCRLMV